jgi:hypothetical protein
MASKHSVILHIFFHKRNFYLGASNQISGGIPSHALCKIRFFFVLNMNKHYGNSKKLSRRGWIRADKLAYGGGARQRLQRMKESRGQRETSLGYLLVRVGPLVIEPYGFYFDC